MPIDRTVPSDFITASAMILDSFSPYSVIFQLQYPDAYEVWDRAGAIARDFAKLWPNAVVVEGLPQQQTLRAGDVDIQSGFSQSTLTFRNVKSLDHTNRQIEFAYPIWKSHLELGELKRISARTIFARKFESLGEANQFWRSLGLIRWPSQRVFEQSVDSEQNGFDLTYRFEDENQFSTVRIRTERLVFKAELDPYFFSTETKFSETRFRAVIEFDRGNLGAVRTEKLRIDDWLKGYAHVLRRDIDKVLGGER